MPLTFCIAIDGLAVVSTLAGLGVKGWIDGAGAVSAFAAPYGVALDAFGYVLVVDTNNQRIRRVIPYGGTSFFHRNYVYFQF